ncbi:MAG: succinylglutamate desuccinylase [Chloroflexi bacterium]|nr:succinylglutamate desuccinylase [Chloroflexota bacterium]
MATLTVGTASAAPGTVAKGHMFVAKHPGGEPYQIPVIVINGAKDGPVLWVDGCWHGDEHEGPLAIFEILWSLDPKKLSGAFVGVPVLNVPAFEIPSRHNPNDIFAYDFGSGYPGSPTGRLTHRAQHQHASALKAVADLNIAIHSGGHHSWVGLPIFARDASLELAKAMGPDWPLLLDSLRPGPPTGVDALMEEKGAQSIVCECGGWCATLPQKYRENGKLVARGLRNVMMHFGMLEGQAQYCQEWWRGYQETVLCDASGLWVPEPHINFMEWYDQGTLLATIYNLHGEPEQEVRAPSRGVNFGMRTMPATHVGDWAVFWGAVRETLR